MQYAIRAIKRMGLKALIILAPLTGRPAFAAAPVLRTLVGHTKVVSQATFLPGSTSFLVTSSWDGSIKAWDVTTGALAWTAPVGAPVNAFTFDPSAQAILVAGKDGLLRLIRAADGKELHRFDDPERHSMMRAAFSPDGKFIVAALHTGKLRLIDATSGAFADFGRHDWPNIVFVAFSQDGRRILSGDPGAILIWDTTTGALLKKIVDPSRCTAAFCTPWLTAAAFSRDLAFVAAGSLNRGIVFDVENGAVIQHLGLFRGEIKVATFSPDGAEVTLQGLDGTVMAWNLTTGELLTASIGDEGPIYNAAVNAARTILIGLDRQNNDVLVQRLEDQKDVITARTDRYEAKVAQQSETSFRLVVHYGTVEAPFNTAMCTTIATSARETRLKCADGYGTMITFNQDRIGRLEFQGRQEDGTAVGISLRCWKPLQVGNGFLNCIEGELGVN